MTEAPPSSSSLAPHKSPRNVKPTTAASDDPANSPRKKKVVGCSEKLAGLRPKSPPLLPPLVKTTQLTQQQLEAHIKRMYEEGVQRKERAKESPRKEAELEGPPHTTRTYMEIEEIVTRLNGHAADAEVARQNLVKAYMDRYQDHTPRTNSPERTTRLSPVGVAASAKRLHDESLRKQREEMQSLVLEYAPPLKSPRMSEEALRQSSQRLFSNKK